MVFLVYELGNFNLNIYDEIVNFLTNMAKDIV